MTYQNERRHQHNKRMTVQHARYVARRKGVAEAARLLSIRGVNVEVAKRVLGKFKGVA